MSCQPAERSTLQNPDLAMGQVKEGTLENPERFFFGKKWKMREVSVSNRLVTVHFSRLALDILVPRSVISWQR